MEVPVRLPQGLALIQLSAPYNIGQLKKDLAEQEDIPVAQQRLVRLGQLLSDEHLIGEAQVNNAPVIQCFDLGARSIAPSIASSGSEARHPVMIKFRVDVSSAIVRQYRSASTPNLEAEW
ncbi:MAG: hypothetical protein Q9194_004324 [Teloschistes cf. exilis]